jgi:hypothetical protein
MVHKIISILLYINLFLLDQIRCDMIYIDQIVRPRVRKKKIILNTITKCWVIFGWEFRVIKHILNTLGNENSPQEGTILSLLFSCGLREGRQMGRN